MHFDRKQFQNLVDFDNLLVVDEKGTIIFYDLADLSTLQELGFRPEEFLGKNITTLYNNLNKQNSTLMQVLQTGESLCNVKQELASKKGNTVWSINSSYPIKENGKIVGAIEFSKHYYSKESMHSLDKYASHKLYRKNNTIYTMDDIITVNPQMEAIKAKIQKIAKTGSTVLIYGKTGTGKEVVAQAIHNLSNRYGKPFISLNCGAIPANLLEGTLFGTTKGSFTDSQDMPGLFELADGGTLFLDEINSLDFNLQVKLLKAIEEKSVRRVGGKKNIHLDIRVISATNEDPERLLADMRLREDLYYRLGVIQIDLPTLAERKEDIALLLSHYVRFYNNNMNMTIEGFEPDAWECFMRYDWPGNIRELKNAVETAYNQAVTDRITIEDIPRRIRRWAESHSLVPVQEMPSPELSLKEAVDEYEKSLIEREWRTSTGKIAETARRLGISKQLLKYKLDKYRLR
ncbi:sigma-54 interaction domain-containing protein [Brevibacillus centrosporus]|uniref:sigma-54 interaction domain-containing protein n=1 Tax=Brevibacillus centrosporus TaxID=54910 RepID=UPI002E245801|nr:sigma 54-interacting transcriptional regulator [Brevibacillus centrosporus]MED1949554.1 sigma 54-interacting transcriptional regulator [Brevibacillus centrosporus]